MPPVAVTLTEPLFCPQLAEVLPVIIVITLGCVMIFVALVLQLFASVTVTVYVPATKPDMFWVVIPLLHKYCIGDVPPLIVSVILPVVPPLHNGLIPTIVLITAPVWFTILPVEVAVQPLASVTVTVYVPDARLLTVPLVDPVFHKYVSVPVPPDDVTVTDPLLWLHVADCAVTPELIAEGCVITCVIFAWHKFASVTVNVYVPNPNVVMFCVVLPLLHKY